MERFFRKLSPSQAKEADRVGGIELMIMYPPELGTPPNIGHDREVEATEAERACAARLVLASCRTYGLLPVHVRVTCARRPAADDALPQEHAGQYRVHLAVQIVSARWIQGSVKQTPQMMFAA